MSVQGLTPGLAPIIRGTNMLPRPHLHSGHLSPLPPGRIHPSSCQPYSPPYPPDLEDELYPPRRGPRAYAAKHALDRVGSYELRMLLMEAQLDWNSLHSWARKAVRNLIPRTYSWSAYSYVRTAASTITRTCRDILVAIDQGFVEGRRGAKLASQLETHGADLFKALHHQLMRLLFYQIELENSRSVPIWAPSELGHETIRLGKLKFLLLAMTDKKRRPVDSAMHVAVRLPSVDLVRQLLGAGVPVDVSSRNGDTPLMTACRMSQVAIVHELLQHGADPNFLSYDGECPLSCIMKNKARRNSDDRRSVSKIAVLLLDAGASIHWTDRNGLPLLHYAIHNRDDSSAADFTYLLLTHGASLADLKPLKDGRSWIHHLAGRVVLHEMPLLQLAVDQGQSVNEATERGHTPVFFAARKGCVATFKWLVSQGADLFCLDEEGSNILFYAPFKEETVQKFLMARAFDPNFSNRFGATALHFAVVRGDILSVGELMRRGAAQMWAEKVYKTHRDWKHGRNPLSGTPYDIAIKLGYRDVAKLIKAMEGMKMDVLTRQIRLETRDIEREPTECESWYGPFRDMKLTVLDTISAVQLIEREERLEGLAVEVESVAGVYSEMDGSNSDVENESPDQGNQDGHGTGSTTPSIVATGKAPGCRRTRSHNWAAVWRYGLWRWMEEAGEMIVPRWLFGGVASSPSDDDDGWPGQDWMDKIEALGVYGRQRRRLGISRPEGPNKDNDVHMEGTKIIGEEEPKLPGGNEEEGRGKDGRGHEEADTDTQARSHKRVKLTHHHDQNNDDMSIPGAEVPMEDPDGDVEMAL